MKSFMGFRSNLSQHMTNIAMVHPSTFRLLSKSEKNSRLTNAKDAVVSKQFSLRAAARLFDIPWSTFRIYYKNPVPCSTRCGHPHALTMAEETIIVNSAIDFAQNGTPLSRESLLDLIQHFCQHLPVERQMSIPFKNLRPSAGFLPGVFKRHQHLSLKRRCNLEHDRSLAMSVQNMAEHFARLTQVYEEYGITSGAQVFNLDESGFSTRTAHRARAKAVCEKQGRSNAREMKCSKNADHVTIMPIVSADGRIYDPVAILPGKRSKWRMRPDGNRETPACFLPENARVAYRDPAGMDTQIFNAFADWFVSATVELRSRHRNIVLTLDGYGAHKSFQALELLKRNNIFVIALPAHTSHRTQVLDYSIFSPFKTYLRNALNERVLTTSGSVRNDIYTLCELVHDAYKRAWTYNNIVSGFLACGLWCPRRKRPLPEVIKLADITNIGEHPSRDAAFKAFAQLTESFKRSRNLLRSDGPVAENGTLNTKAGALLTSQDILDYLESRAKSRAIAAAEKVAREVAALQRRSERETEADERARARRDAEDARLFHVTWMSLRDSRARGLLNSRGQRRVIARQRALRTKGITPQI